MDRKDFRIGIVCALPLEANAVTAILDRRLKREERPHLAEGDINSYTFGVIDRFKVVIAHLGEMGNVASSRAGQDMSRSFPGVKLCLVVGICGAVPSIKGNEVLLGDVVLSSSVVQYDFGRQFENAFRRKGQVEDTMGRAPPQIRNYFSNLRTNATKQELRSMTHEYLQEVVHNKLLEDKYHYPGHPQCDHLYKTSYLHKHRGSSNCAECEAVNFCQVASEVDCKTLKCSATELVTRNRIENIRLEWGRCKGNKDEAFLKAILPQIHIGGVASANKVLKSAAERDKIATDENVIAFEMEGAGIWDVFPTVIIKSVCDYADSHKNKVWQKYAAATAASCSKAFLELSNVPGDMKG